MVRSEKGNRYQTEFYITDLLNVYIYNDSATWKTYIPFKNYNWNIMF